MTSVFDVDALLPLLMDFYDITGIRLTVFDAEMHELVSWPAQQPPFCQCIRSREAGLAACKRCDAEAFRRASLGKKPYVYGCHAGLMEAALPLHVGDVLVGYLGCGHVFAYPDRATGLEQISQKTRQLGLCASEIELAADTHPNLTEKYMHSAVRIMQATASYLILEHMAALREDSAAAQLDAYLNAHFSEALTAESTGAALNMSRSDRKSVV